MGETGEVLVYYFITLINKFILQQLCCALYAGNHKGDKHI